MEELLSFMNFKLDEICMSETRLNNNNCNLVNLPGYSLSFNNSPTSAGGAAINVSKNVDCSDNSSSSTFIGGKVAQK